MTWNGTPALGDEGAAPATSPAILSVTGSATGLTVVTEPILPTTLLDFYVNGALVEANQRTTVINLTDDGTNPLVVDTDYTITTQAHNGVSPDPSPSASVTARLDPGMTAAEVVAVLQAGFILAGTIQVGSSMTLDGVGGITITQPDRRQTFMHADGSGNQFIGQAILDAVTILGVLSIQSGATLSSTLTLLSGVTDPSSKPGVTAAGWDSVANPAGANYGFATRGLYDNGTGWVYTDSLGTSGNVSSINKITGARGLLATLPGGFAGLGGVAKVSTSWYVLGQDTNRSNNWYVYIFNASWVKTGEWVVTDASSGHSCALGLDGAGGLLIARRSTTSNFTINAWSTVGVESAATGTYPTWAGATITGVWKAAVDTATVRYVVSSLSDGIRVFNTSTAARVAAEEWPPAAGALGLGNDGSNWFTLDAARVWKYTNLIGTWDFAFDLADTDTSGSSGAGTGLGGANTARTRQSTLYTVAPTKRAKWTVSLPSPPPDDGTSDGANTADLYAAPTGTTLVLQTTLADGVYSATYSTLATSGTAPSTTNGFAARPGAVGSVASATSDGTGPLWKLNGDGTWDIAAFTRAWSTYTPALTATTTNPVLGTGSSAVGRYQRIGTTVRFRLRITFGTSGASFGSGIYIVSLPPGLPMLDTNGHRFIGALWDNSASQDYEVITRLAGSTLPLSVPTTNGALNNVTPTFPFTFAVSDYIELWGEYETAP